MDRHQLEFYLDGDGGYPGSHFSEAVWLAYLSSYQIDDAEYQSEVQWAANRANRRNFRMQQLLTIWRYADDRNKPLLCEALPTGAGDLLTRALHGQVPLYQAVDALHHVLDMLPLVLYRAYPQLRTAVNEYLHANNGAIGLLFRKLAEDREAEA
jgi:hypothetical protein